MSRLEQYERYRTMGQQLHGRILDACVDHGAILDSADVLDIERDGQAVLYEDEVEMTVHYEFLLHEYRRNGQTPVDRYYEEQRWETEAEKRFLEAVRNADTSLFGILAVDDARNCLTVTDRMNGQEGTTLTDVGLSDTVEPGIQLFFRLVRCDGFNMTSGITLPFPADEDGRVLREYEKRSPQFDAQSATAQRFAAFYHLYREYGR